MHSPTSIRTARRKNWQSYYLVTSHETRQISDGYVVADAWFSKSTFINKLLAMGFHLISRLRDDSALWYSHNGVRTGKRGRPRGKGEKIDFDNLELSHCEPLDVEGGRAFVIKAYSVAMKRNIKIVVHYPQDCGTLSGVGWSQDLLLYRP